MALDVNVARFVDNLALQNANSANTVRKYLNDLQTFAESEYQITVAELINRIKSGTATADPKEEQVYRVLQGYAAWLKVNRIDSEQNNARTVKLKISWARTLLESNFIPISRTLFKQLVKSPKVEEPELSPVDKKSITNLILALDNIRAQSFAMWLGSTGWRASESLSLRLANLEGFNIQMLKFEKLPAFVNTSGKFAKTKKGKRRQITTEMAKQIEKLAAYNYRTRIVKRKEGSTWKNYTIAPKPKPEDRLFAAYHSDDHLTKFAGKEPSLQFVYNGMSVMFREAVDRLGIGFEEAGKRRKLTMHSLRRFCFTTCSRKLGRGYAEYHTGRKTHEYERSTPEMIAEDFARVEPFLTFLDASGLEEKYESLQKQLDSVTLSLNHALDYMRGANLTEEEKRERDRQRVEEYEKEHGL